MRIIPVHARPQLFRPITNHREELRVSTHDLSDLFTPTKVFNWSYRRGSSAQPSLKFQTASPKFPWKDRLKQLAKWYLWSDLINWIPLDVLSFYDTSEFEFKVSKNKDSLACKLPNTTLRWTLSSWPLLQLTVPAPDSGVTFTANMGRASCEQGQSYSLQL